ncbi:hypothetical protein [Terrihabitans rhizophilus]|uniref:Uncharacterized protein n=1 Tax=Terrihabitans rhizophilus TaxID=3092662 RepID=A0ABU4RQL9_9HYPH|nr:hypothetical protein [Terrihabitans sp. PJ23]MDX6807154.1 hypothetical protein [Terrihabitans sp. PJ23]
MAAALGKTGKTPEEIERLMIAAGRDMQGEFMMADAMGNAGQRALSTVARTPNDARQPVVERLLARKEGQGARLGAYVDEAFDAGSTARQSAAELRQWGQDASRPFYEKALAQPAVQDERLGQFFADPIMKRGLREGLEVQRLESLARGEKFDPFDYVDGFDEAGDPSCRRCQTCAPSTSRRRASTTFWKATETALRAG